MIRNQEVNLEKNMNETLFFENITYLVYTNISIPDINYTYLANTRIVAMSGIVVIISLFVIFMSGLCLQMLYLLDIVKGLKSLLPCRS